MSKSAEPSHANLKSSSSTSSASPPEVHVPLPTDFDFAISKVPKNPLGEGNYIKTAAALIIGDEILNGKTRDTNSNYFARFCFNLGIELKRIEVIADDEQEIVEASRRMVKMYDFVITSGGIGPTHDDITYASLATSFDQKLVHHTETLERMEAMVKNRKAFNEQNADQRKAMHRMALFPERAEVLFTAKDVWVPVVRLEGKLCIFPGIPALFQKMLDGLTPFLPLPDASSRPLRLQIFTKRPESMIAPYLTDLQKRVSTDGIQVGSYPIIQQGVHVSLIGKNKQRVQAVAEEVAKEIEGQIMQDEEAARYRESCSRPATPETAQDVQKDSKL